MSPRTPYVLGLTGSIGMGKSTTAQMFADEGLPVWDADATVHRLYQPGQPAALAIGQVFPTAIDPDGSVNRATLRALIEADKTVLDRLNGGDDDGFHLCPARFRRQGCRGSGWWRGQGVLLRRGSDGAVHMPYSATSWSAKR